MTTIFPGMTTIANAIATHAHSLVMFGTPYTIDIVGSNFDTQWKDLKVENWMTDGVIVQLPNGSTAFFRFDAMTCLSFNELPSQKKAD